MNDTKPVPDCTPEQLRALREYAATKRGRNWKTQLMDAWRTSHYGYGQIDKAVLQQIRNQKGPRWLLETKFDF